MLDILKAFVLSRCEERIAWEDTMGDWEDWLDVQIAAINALGEMGTATVTETLFEARDDEFAQTLHGPIFAALSKMGNVSLSWLLSVIKTETGLGPKRAASVLVKTEALQALTQALSGTLLSQEEAVIERPSQAGPDAAAPCDDVEGPARIHITGEGDIVEDDALQFDTRQSTLDALTAPMRTELPLAEATPEESPDK